MKYLKAMAHVCLVLAIVFVVFFCIDRVNPSMEFISSEMSKWLLFIFAVCVLSLCVMTLIYVRMRERGAIIRQQAVERRLKKSVDDEGSAEIESSSSNGAGVGAPSSDRAADGGDTGSNMQDDTAEYINFEDLFAESAYSDESERESRSDVKHESTAALPSFEEDENITCDSTVQEARAAEDEVPISRRQRNEFRRRNKTNSKPPEE